MAAAVTLYHNPRCQKSRLALQELEEKGLDVKVVEYLKTPPTEAQLKKLSEQLQVKPQDMVRTSEELYKEEYKGAKLSDKDWLKAIAEHPILLQRPIVVKGEKAVIAREEGVLTKFLK